MDGSFKVTWWKVTKEKMCRRTQSPMTLPQEWEEELGWEHKSIHITFATFSFELTLLALNSTIPPKMPLSKSPVIPVVLHPVVSFSVLVLRGLLSLTEAPPSRCYTLLTCLLPLSVLRPPSVSSAGCSSPCVPVGATCYASWSPRIHCSDIFSFLPVFIPLTITLNVSLEFLPLFLMSDRRLRLRLTKTKLITHLLPSAAHTASHSLPAKPHPSEILLSSVNHSLVCFSVARICCAKSF